MPIHLVDRETYERERAICDKAEAYRQRITEGKRNYLTKEEAAAPEYAACDNAMRGRVEQFEILRDPPETIFAYVSSDKSEPRITTWMGDTLSGFLQCTARWRTPGSYVSSYMHQYRASIAGREYTGRGAGSGMCITLRETAASKRRHPRVPASFPVHPLSTQDEKEAAGDLVTCGECGLSWDDSIPTSYTPAPSARCPFERFHNPGNSK